MDAIFFEEIILPELKELLQTGDYLSVLNFLKNNLICNFNRESANTLAMLFVRSNNIEREYIQGINPFINNDKLNLTHSILGFIENLPKQMKLYDQLEKYNNVVFSYKKDKFNQLEAIIGRDTLTKINWLEKGIQISKAVCRVATNKGYGTGFITGNGYLLTNQHVIENNEVAKRTYIEFNYQENTNGTINQVTSFSLDAEDCLFNPFQNPDGSQGLDYALVKIVDTNNKLKTFGSLPIHIDYTNLLRTNDPVTIIQHPNAEPKQIAFTGNEISQDIDKTSPFINYRTDTRQGSSGSPVFDLNWNVVALHHAGDETQNEGVLINKIFEDIKSKGKNIL